MLLSSPAGNDLLFDESLCEQGRNFANKIWNAFRLVKGWEEKVDNTVVQPESARVAIEWMNARFQAVLADLNDDYDKFRINEALMSTYKLVWDDFCAWYLEMVKPAYGSAMDATTYAATVTIFENILKVLHPFMPFLTEEIWHFISERAAGTGSLCVATWPEANEANPPLLGKFDQFTEVMIGLRNIRKENNIPQKEKLSMKVKAANADTTFDANIIHLGNLESIEYSSEKPSNSFTFIVNGNEYFVPFTANVDVEGERKKLTDELNYTRGFLKSVEAKLGNERFVNNAPAAVLETERKKQSDALSKIAMIEEKLSTLN